MTFNIDILTEEVAHDVSRWRQHIHANPDLSFQEQATADYIAAQLAGFGPLELRRLTPNSVVAELKGNIQAPCGHCVQILMPCRFRKKAAKPSLHANPA